MKKWLILFPPAVLLLLFFYLPLANLLGEGIWIEGGLGLRPLFDIILDPYYWGVIRFTTVQAIYSTLLSLVIGLIGAWMLSRYQFRGRKLLLSLTAVPFVLPAITVVSGFITFFGNNGFLNRTLMNLFALENPPLRILYSLQGIILAHAFYNAPIVTRMVEARWNDIDPSYEESAAIAGAGRWTIFRKVLIPLLAPALAASSALVFIFCFLSFPIVLTLGGARLSTIEVEIYTLVQTLGKYKLGAALALLEIFFSLTFTYLYLRLESRFSVEILSLKQRKREMLFRGRVDTRKLFAATFAVLAAILFIGPLFGVVYHSLSAGGTFTLNWYGRIFSAGYEALIGAAPLKAIQNSLSFALGAALLSAVIGIPLAYTLARGEVKGGKVFDALAMLPLGVSSVALGFAFLEVFIYGPFSLLPRSAIIIIVHAVLAYPFFIRTLVPALRSLKRELIESAELAGGNRWDVFWRVELPIIRGPLLAGLAFVFAISMGEMSATIMLIRPGVKTIPIAIYELIGARQFGSASALSVLLMVIVGFVFFLIDRVGGGFWEG